jgi:hypothetical protein
MVVLTACGGGGSSGGVTDNTTITSTVPIVQEETQKGIEEISGVEGGSGTMVVKETEETLSWKPGEIKYFSRDDKMPEGMFFKISNIETKNGKQDITYTTPTLDEVFDELNITMDSNVSFVVDSVRMSKYARLHVNQYELPLGAKGKLSKFVRDPDMNTTKIKGNGWNLFKKLGIDFNIPVIESGHMSLTLGGKFNLDNIHVTKFHMENYHAASDFKLLSKDSFLNKLTPITGIHYALGLEYDAQKEFSIEGKIESKFSLAEIAKETMFECGITTSKSIRGASVGFTSSGYGEHDICLGSVGVAFGYDAKKHILVPGVDLNAGSGKSLLKIALDIALVLGLDGDVHLAMKFSGKKNSYNLMEGEIDTHKLTNDFEHFMMGRSVESLEKGSTKKTKWIHETVGEISGKIEHYMGLAVALHISNITPIGLRGYGGIKADATAQIYNRNGEDWAACSNVGLDLIYGVELMSRNSLNIKLSKNSKISKWVDQVNENLHTSIKKEFNPGINFKFPIFGGDDAPIAITRYNSCESSEYSAKFITSPYKIDDLNLENITVEHYSGLSVIPEAVYYIVYDDDGKVVKTGSDSSLVADLNSGTYTIKVILEIDHTKAVKTSVTTIYIVQSDTTPPVITINGDNPVTLIKDDTYNDVGATASDDVDGDVSVTTLSNDVDTSVVGTYHVTYSAKDSAGNESNATREVKVEEAENKAPIAVAKADPTTTTEGEEVTFDASDSSDSDGEIVSYEWKEGDTILSTEKSFSEDNLSVGDHTITLTVTDDDDANDSDSVTVTINSSESTGEVKKTGQSVSYDEDGNETTDGSLKDDGYYQKGVDPDYTRDDDKEVVVDNLTGLMWQDNEDVENMTKQWLTDENYDICDDNDSRSECYDTSGDTATTYCEELELGDYTDWRLPTSKELEGIVDYGKVDPAIDTSVFQHTSSYGYWSSTTYEGYHEAAWYVYFYGGSVGSSYKDAGSYVRCVRAGQ